MRIIKKHYDGLMFPGTPEARAKQLLKNYKEGMAYISCLSGQNLFIKENGVVRDSTIEEWKEYHTKQARKAKDAS